MAVRVKAAQRTARLRSLLLLLLLVQLSSIAIWTPAALQAATANTMELWLAPNVTESRTAAGPGPLVGQLDVSHVSSGVEVFVDGELHGATPMQLVLRAGCHELTFASPVGVVQKTVRIWPGRLTVFSEPVFPGSPVPSVLSSRRAEDTGRNTSAI